MNFTAQNVRAGKVILAVALLVTVTPAAQAGNRDRNGQSGATELLVNPGGRSTGVFGMDVANTIGSEAMRVNIAGLAKTEKMEIGIAYQRYLSGSGVGVTNGSLALALGNAGVFGVNIHSMNFGELTQTNYNNPDGGIGTFQPQFYNITLGFAKEFSNSIHAGVSATFVNEQVQNSRANGACFDAGVQYTTGRRDNFHFGITLRNVGTNMRFSGPAFANPNTALENENYQLNQSIPQEAFQMPTYLTFGAAYDLYLDENRLRDDSSTPNHRLTVMGAFTSNSFLSDYLGGGLEYGFRNIVMLRAGYRYELDRGESTTTAQGEDTDGTSFYTGFSAGATVQTRLGKTGPMVGVDYSYRPTSRPANGVHAFGLKFNLR